jgi:SlyX protein
MAADDARLEALESKLAFQEDTVAQLNDALIAQQSRIDRLETLVKLLAEQVRATPEDAPGVPEPPPPHY